MKLRYLFTCLLSLVAVHMTFAQEVKRDLQDNVFFIVEATIKPDQFDNFLKMAEHMSEVVIGEEPGAFNYEWTINSDSSKCFILERYANSTATLEHMKLFRAQFAEKFYGVLEVTGFTLYGNPGPEVLEGLGISEGAVRKKVAGFAR